MENWKQNLQHILEVEFTTTDYPTRRSYLTTDGKFISTPNGKDPHYVIDNFIANTITGIMGTNYEQFKNCTEEEVKEYLSKYNLTLEDIKEIDSHLNYSNMGHNCGSPELERNLNLIRLNGGVHGECYMLLPSTPINNIQLNQLERWLDKFFYQPIEIDWDDGDGNLDISQYIDMMDNNYNIYKPKDYSPKQLMGLIRGVYNGIYHRMNESYGANTFDISKVKVIPDDKYALSASLDFIKDNVLREQIKKMNKFLTSTPLTIMKRIWGDLAHQVYEEKGFSLNLNSGIPVCFELRYDLKGIQIETINHDEAFITLTLMLHPLTPTIFFTFWNIPPYTDLIDRVFKNPYNMKRIGDAFKSHIVPVLQKCVDAVTPARTQVSLR